MRFRLALIVPVAALALTVCQAAFAAPGGNRYIVILNPGASVDAVVASYTKEASLSYVYTGGVDGFAAQLAPKTRAELESDPRVLFISRDGRVRAAAQTTPTGVSRIGAGQGSAAPGVPSTDGAGVGVGVIDTGIDLSHPDLANTQNGINCIHHGQSANDDNGHGTHVAGTIAARDNGVGVIGVAPAATLYAIKALDSSGSGTISSLICGIVWSMNRWPLVRVVNMSVEASGTATPSNPNCTNSRKDSLHFVLCRATQAGITFVAAAGNASRDAAGTIPAAYEEVIAVSALADSDGRPGGLGGRPSCLSSELDDHFATFSNFGSVVDLAAPGVCILSTYRGGGYATLSGTSMAAPHVTGAAARYIQTHPAALPAEVRSALIASAEPGPIPGDPDAYPEGVVHVTALTAVGPVSSPLPGLPAGPVVPPLLPTLPLLPPLAPP
jgi:subtilisin family serine protease